MDKLNLNLDDLEVDSFQTNPEQEGEQGTVQGNDHTPCCTEHGGDTCADTCVNTCNTCLDTCDYSCLCRTEPDEFICAR